MNAAVTAYVEQEFEYKAEFRAKATANSVSSTSRPNYSRRRGKRPASFNGIHRRRQRKIKW